MNPMQTMQCRDNSYIDLLTSCKVESQSKRMIQLIEPKRYQMAPQTWQTTGR